jgi:hypothetical protein
LTTHVRRPRLAAILVGALCIGLAAGAVSYLASSLVIGPAVRADTEELRERGAQTYFVSCGQFFEPRFWPECVGDANAKRARGARELVAFCTDKEPYNRFFHPEDCLSDNGPLLALTGGPRPIDAVAGGVATVAAIGVLGVHAMLRRGAGTCQAE